MSRSAPGKAAVAVTTPPAAVAPALVEREQPEDREHEVAALFRGFEQELVSLEGRVLTALERGGTAHGRRLALLRTAIEAAMLQARQGVHESHYSQK